MIPPPGTSPSAVVQPPPPDQPSRVYPALRQLPWYCPRHAHRQTRIRNGHLEVVLRQPRYNTPFPQRQSLLVTFTLDKVPIQPTADLAGQGFPAGTLAGGDQKPNLCQFRRREVPRAVTKGSVWLALGALGRCRHVVRLHRAELPVQETGVPSSAHHGLITHGQNLMDAPVVRSGTQPPSGVRGRRWADLFPSGSLPLPTRHRQSGRRTGTASTARARGVQVVGAPGPLQMDMNQSNLGTNPSQRPGLPTTPAWRISPIRRPCSGVASVARPFFGARFLLQAH